MKAIPHKSKLRYLAHNPTGELMWILSKEVKKCYGKEKKKEFST